MFTLLHGGVRNHRDGLLQSTVSKVRTTTPSPTLPTNQSIRLHCRPAGKGRWSQTVVLVVERFLRQTLLTCDSRSFNGCMKRESCRDSPSPHAFDYAMRRHLPPLATRRAGAEWSVNYRSFVFHCVTNGHYGSRRDRRRGERAGNSFRWVCLAIRQTRSPPIERYRRVGF